MFVLINVFNILCEKFVIFFKMWCAVVNCSNNNDSLTGLSFFEFPKDKKLLKIWLQFCKRKENIKVKTACVCSAHFKEEDIANNLQFKMGFAKKRLLVAGAYPTIDPQASHEPSQRSKRKMARDNKKLVNDAMQEFEQTANDEASAAIEVSAAVEVSPFVEEDQQILEMRNKIEQLQRENFSLKEKQREHLAQISALEVKLTKEKFENENMQKQLGALFTKGQVKKIRNGVRRKRWSEEDIAHPVALYSSGARTYARN